MAEQRQSSPGSMTSPPTSLPDAAILIRAGHLLNSTLDLPQLQDEVLQLVGDVCRASAVILLLVERKTENFIALRGWDRGQNKFIDYPVKLANRLYSWVQNQNPDGKSVTNPLPERVAVGLQELLADPGTSDTWCALRRRGRMSGAVGVISATEGAPDRASLLAALADQIATSLDNALLFRAVKRRSSEARILLQTSEALAGSLDLDDTLGLILDRLHEVVPYDAAGIFLIDRESGELVPIISRGFDADRQDHLRRKSDEGLVGYAVSTGETVVVGEVDTDPRYKNAREATRSELVIPLTVAGRLIGAFDLERDVVHGFAGADVRLTAAFAVHAGLAIERARLYQESLEKKRLDGELEIARSIQQTFLPKKNPVIPGYDLAGINVPSEEVGGDYYDFIPIVEHQMGIAIGDVSGKGIPAALIMAAFRASLIAEIRNNYAIRTVFTKVNALLEETSEQGRFVTAMYGVLDSKNGIFTFANAGHNPGIMLRSDDTVEYLSEGGLPFGIMPDTVYEERPISIGAGDIMLWYTDGVTDTVDSSGELYEIERLTEVVRSCRDQPAAEILQAIYRAIKDFAVAGAVADDVTMVILKASQKSTTERTARRA